MRDGTADTRIAMILMSLTAMSVASSLLPMINATSAVMTDVSAATVQHTRARQRR
jgi:hypothetical protein